MADETRADGVEERPDGTVHFWYAGQSYELSGMEPDDFPVLRERLRERRGDPLRSVAEAMDQLKAMPGIDAATRKEMRDALLDRAYAEIKQCAEDRAPTRQAVAEWIDSTEAGAVYSLFIMLRRKTPDMTEDLAAKLLKAVGQAQFLKRRDQASRRLLEQAEAARHRTES